MTVHIRQLFKIRQIYTSVNFLHDIRQLMAGDVLRQPERRGVTLPQVRRQTRRYLRGATPSNFEVPTCQL